MNEDDLFPYVVDDLRRLAKRPGTRQLAAMHAVIELAGLTPTTQMITMGYDWIDLGNDVREFLWQSLKGFNQPVWCYVRELEPAEFSVAMGLALGLYVSTTIGSVKDRRMQTMLYLQMPYEYETWRKYEVILFEALARHILECKN